jgi:hypothetical protein
MAARVPGGKDAGRHTGTVKTESNSALPNSPLLLICFREFFHSTQ